VFVPGTPALAHNALRSASPAPNATHSAAPTEITLEFVERLNPTYTTIVLTDAAQRKVPTGDLVISGERGTVRMPEKLPNGPYAVAYRVVSADGHPVQGSYPFVVADPDADPAPTSDTGAPTAIGTEAVARSAGGPGVGVLATTSAIILAATVAGLLLWRRVARH
jgi:methionine-rich copper-binding protein CopC